MMSVAMLERGWRDSRDRRNEREANKSAGHDTHPKDGKPEVKEEEKNVWRHDRFQETEANPERDHKTQHLDKREKSYRGEALRGGFPPRERYVGNGGNYRGRDRYGGKQGYHSSNGRVEKWKHDLFHEANRSPTLKNEENQIAKVEALLAS
ncbi:uncharacterized protein LOC119981897 [Tripterygium wilfordii]|uniref:uncharacterized protein LOC119981897 n=1 Tax=Tripterygium wilfordii TaxID=458696 RepID=UPI0018F80BF1|nr:uncharacterized protein LOC119981897 [Tripterygium wilfordii]